MSLMKYELPYHHDSAQLFTRIAHRPWAIFLDSGHIQAAAQGKSGSQYGRFDILVADPFITFISDDTKTTIAKRSPYNAGQSSLVSGIEVSGTEVSGDPFLLLKEALAPYTSIQHDLPFTGGAVGYFGYDLARYLEKLENRALHTDQNPVMQVGIYDWVVVVDHRNKTSCLVSQGFDKQTHAQWDALCALFEAPVESDNQAPEFFAVTSTVTSNMNKQAYAEAFDKIQHYIHEGDCYQVNLAQRFSAQAQGDGWPAYQQLRKISPAPFMAYMNLDSMQVLSGSPERFLQVKDRHVETRPIKGTRPRAEDPELDAQHAADLQSSIKDKAENLMIVDLLRNDIGKNCETASVKANQLFQLQSFANVHHLVSIVTGKLHPERTALDLLRGCFPGGSITGAPKLRAMEIIEALEPHHRGVYCGAIGYIGFDGNMDTNIAIRTVVYVRNEQGSGEISFYAGGGIVADSELEKEYTETLDKASSMLKLMDFFKSK